MPVEAACDLPSPALLPAGHHVSTAQRVQARCELLQGSPFDPTVVWCTAIALQADYHEVTYEAYGPGGTGFIVDCLTDNLNRWVKHLWCA